jgi:flagellar hook assembly protein FlgD
MNRQTSGLYASRIAETGIEDAYTDISVNKHFYFYPISPNPVIRQTVIQYSITTPSNASLKIYNSLGAHIKTLTDGYHHAGTHHRLWDGKDKQRRAVANGIYFCRLEVGGRSQVHRLILLK